MAVVTGSKAAEPGTLYLSFDAPRPSTASIQWMPVVRAAMLLGGAVLGAIGVSLGLAVVWTQLARALPLASLLHHPRAVWAITLVGAGLALILLGRRGRLANSSGSARVVIALLLVAAAAPPALAVDATGTWSGMLRCRRQVGTTVTRTRLGDSTMLITQRDRTLFIELDGTPYDGQSQASERNPRLARASAVLSTDDGVDGEALSFRIRVNEARGTAKIRGTSKIPFDPGSHCNYRFSRTSLEDPHVGPPEERHTPCAPLDVSGNWSGTWNSDVTGDHGEVVADLTQHGDIVSGMISFQPFDDTIVAAPFIVMSSCAPAAFTTGALLASGIATTLDGIATNTSLAGTWALSDGSDSGAWSASR